MTTDTWPSEFRYVSRRLVAQIVQRNEAKRPRRSVSFGFNLGLATVNVTGRPPDYGKVYDLVRRATEHVSDNTGTLAHPGLYVRSDLELDLCWFPVLLGWADGARRGEIAAIFADTTLDDTGRTFVALFGSIFNYVAMKPKPVDGVGVFPSDLAGLYQILNATLTGWSTPPRCRQRLTRPERIVAAA